MKRPLTRDEVSAVVERRCAKGIFPMFLCNWWGQGIEEKYGSALKEIENDYPEDVFLGELIQPGSVTSTTDNPQYRWGYKDDYSQAAAHSIAQDVELLETWDDFDLLLHDFPDPGEPDAFKMILQDLPKAGNRYKVGLFWRVFHEFFWTIRGMENLMLDYFDEMDNLKILGQRVLAFHKGIVDRYAALGFDAIMTSDDLGHQSGPMMSPAIFEELYLPLYRELIDYVHSKHMHFWLHSCGDNTKLMDLLVRAGVDVLHPLQKGCMDEATTIRQYGDRMSFLYGVDVQHLLPSGTPEEIRDEIRRVKSYAAGHHGGLLFAAGNGILADTPLENIRAMFETVCEDREDA